MSIGEWSFFYQAIYIGTCLFNSLLISCLILYLNLFKYKRKDNFKYEIKMTFSFIDSKPYFVSSCEYFPDLCDYASTAQESYNLMIDSITTYEDPY